jgi:hypothetical protein
MDRLRTFFKLLFGQNSGIVCVAYINRQGKKTFEEEFFEYPAQVDVMLQSIEDQSLRKDTYFCPQLLRERKRTKENILLAPNVWSDLDTCDPDNLLVEPSVVLQTSPGRYQAFWVLEQQYDVDDVEEMSRRIAYAHAEEGADRSGWDLTQLLRVPYTYNRKYPGEEHEVKILEANKGLYRLTDFDEYPQTSTYVPVADEMPQEADLPQDAEAMLQAKRMEINPLVWRLFTQEPDSDWSKPLWNLQMLLFEAGFSREEVFVIAREAACNKYARDGRSQNLLWKEVCRAEAKAAAFGEAMVPREAVKAELLSEEEKALVETLEPTFVERYMEWAAGLGDAAKQYHQAGAFVILSSLLSGSVRLPTSYGTIVPNLWFMILADTTLTRKTTAMDIAMDLAMEVDEDILMATDGSIEGLLTTLSTRPGKPSVFLRDEFSGLLEQMTKKDYMAGMPELLTKLYDAKPQKRVLRKEIIEVRDPRLVFFAGGIKNKITSILNYEHVSSGFMPRFVFITAESDITRLKPIGPPSARTTGNKDALLGELLDLYKHYNRTHTIQVAKLKNTIEQVMKFDAYLTDEAWIRYNQLESILLEAGLMSNKPDIMTPVGDRLAKSILKAAVLSSASRQKRDDDKIEVTVEDILRAIKYGEQWYIYAQEVMAAVGKGSAERSLDTMYNAIARKQGGVTRSYMMQSYHLTARDADQIFATLEQRGLIRRQKQGRTELLTAVPTH